MEVSEELAIMNSMSFKRLTKRVFEDAISDWFLIQDF